MKIDKSKLAKALKQIGIFVGKNAIDKTVSLVHFRNENKKAMLFATDFASAGRTYFDTDEDGLFEFCVGYDQLLQSTRARGKELEISIYNDRKNDAGESTSGIEITDGKSKFNLALHGIDSLNAQESAAVIPTGVTYFEIDAKTMKNAIKEAGFARDEKDTQNPFLTGINFEGCGADISMVSTNRHRIAGWKKPNTETLEGMEANEVNGILSPKTISSIGMYDDDETIRLYITDSQIVIVSSNLEAYASKIMSTYPDVVQKMFTTEVLSSYRLSANELKESIEIVLGSEKSVTLEFHSDSVVVSAKSQTGDSSTNDSFPCERLSGGDEKIELKADDILSAVKNISDDSMTIALRKMGNGHKMLSYSFDDGAYGIMAPMTR